MRCDYRPSKITNVRKTIPSVGKDVEKIECSYISCRRIEWDNDFAKFFGSFSKSKCNYMTQELPQALIWIREMKKYTYQKIFEEWLQVNIKNEPVTLWLMNNQIVTQSNNRLLLADEKCWVHLKNILLNRSRQKQNSADCRFSLL